MSVTMTPARDVRRGDVIRHPSGRRYDVVEADTPGTHSFFTVQITDRSERETPVEFRASTLLPIELPPPSRLVRAVEAHRDRIDGDDYAELLRQAMAS